MASSASPVPDVPTTGTPLRHSSLTRGLLGALERPPVPQLAARPVTWLVGGLLTFGIWPAWAVAGTLRDLGRNTRWLGDNLSQWAAIYAGPDERPRLESDAAAVASTTRASAATARTLVAVAAVVGILAWLSGVGLGEFWRLRWGADWRAIGFHGLVFSSLLVSAWGAVASRRRLRRLRADLASTLGKRAGPGERVRPPVAGTIVGVLLAAVGFTWALPLVLVAWLYRRTLVYHDGWRSATADDLRSWLENDDPVTPLPTRVDRTEPCVNPRCDARVALASKFCPRCGAEQFAPAGGPRRVTKDR